LFLPATQKAAFATIHNARTDDFFLHLEMGPRARHCDDLRSASQL
jgi:hypothetical protein